MTNENKNPNYYLNESIDSSGVANTQSANKVILPTYKTNYNPFTRQSPIYHNVGRFFTDDSEYDATSGDVQQALEEGLTIEDLRANSQSGWDLAVNALANHAVIAGTTAVQGTIGTVVGLFQAALEQDVSKIWDNPVNNAMIDIADATQKALPIHRGAQYEQMSLGEKMTKGIFWADYVQNMGYTTGMAIPGMGVASALAKAPKMLQTFGASFVGALGEAATEAIHKRNEQVELQKQKALNSYNELAAQGVPLNKLNQDYLETIDNIEQDATTAGNFIYGANTALLTLTNGIVWNKLWQRGASTTKRLKGAVYRTKDTYKSIAPLQNIISKGATHLVEASAEGLEEVSQGIIQRTPENYVSWNTFNESQFNPEKRELATNMIGAVGNAISQTMNDSNTGVEFMSGFLTRLIGVPTVRKRAVPVSLRGNIFSEMYDAYSESKRGEEIANTINSRLSDSKEFNSYYNGLVRHIALQDMKDESIEENDLKTYHDAETAQLLSDIMMFDEAGDLEHLKDLINNTIDLSDEGIQQLIDSSQESGEGVFTQNGNNLSIEETRDIIKKSQEHLNNVVDNYIKTKELVTSNYPELDNKAVSNQVFLRGQLDSMKDRIETLRNEINEEYLNSYKDLIKTGQISEQSFTPDLLYKQDKTEEEEQLIKQIESNFIDSSIIEQKVEDFGELITSIEEIQKEINDTKVNPKKSTKIKEKVEAETIEKSQQSAINNIKDKLKQSKDLNEFKEILTSNTNTEDSFVYNEAFKQLLEEKNDLAVEYQNKENHYRVAKNKLAKYYEGSTNSYEKQYAEDLLNYHYNLQSNLKSISDYSNLDIVDPNDFESSIEVNEEDKYNVFPRVKYYTQLAISDANNDARFKDSIRPEYKTPPEKIESAKGVSKETTGYSETSTVPSVETSPTKPIVTSTPESTSTISEQEQKILSNSLDEFDENVTDTTNENVLKENNSNNNISNTQKTSNKEQKKFYFSIIPELSRRTLENDFRPFDEVMREEGKDFDVLYSKLKPAFDYINKGNLKEGDEIQFMIDPQFEDLMKDKEFHTVPTIFMVKSLPFGEHQILGVLPENTEVVSRYEGLAELRQRVEDEYQKHMTKRQSIDISKLNKDFIILNEFISQRGRNTGNYVPIFFKYTTEEGFKHFVASRNTSSIFTPELVGVTLEDFIGTPEDYDLQENYELAKEEALSGLSVKEIHIRPNGDISIYFLQQQSVNQTAAKAILDYLINQSNSSAFVAKPTTKVSKIMVGKVPISKESSSEKSLNDIFDVTGSITRPANKPQFAIIKNEQFVFGEDSSLKNEDVRFLDPSDKEGNLYVILPNGANTYNPMRVRVKHFNPKEYPLVGTLGETNNKTYIGQDLVNIINDLASVKSQSSLQNVINNLRTILYFKDYDIMYTSEKDGTEKLVFQQFKKNADGTYQTYTDSDNKTRIKKDRKVVKLTDNKNLFNDILNTLYSYNLQFQVSAKRINTTGYNRRLISSNILTSNITNPKVLGNWFTTDYFDTNGVLQEAVNPEGVKTTVTPIKEEPKEESVIITPEGIKITSIYSGKDYYIDIANNKIKTSDGKEVPITNTNEILIYLARAQKIYGDSTEGTLLMDNIMYVSDDKIVDRTKQKYLTGEEAENFKKKFKERQEKLDSVKENKESEETKETKEKTPTTELENALNKEVEDKKEKSQTGASKANNKLNKLKKGSKTRPRLRQVDTSIKYVLWNKEEELAWLDKVLPNISKENRLEIYNDLIRIANYPEAWGAIDKGIMKLSDIASEGTTYHEAFHIVFNSLLSQKEQESIFKEAKEKYKKEDLLELEELLAEEFREYVMIQQSIKEPSIKNYFKRLLLFIKNWFKLPKHTLSLFRKIDKGDYAESPMKKDLLGSLTRTREEEYNKEIQDIKNKAISDGTFMKAPNGNPTNLTERQWLHVRTKAFKDWFGDWVNPYNNNIAISLDIDIESSDSDGFGSLVRIIIKDKNNPLQGEVIGTIPMQQQIKNIKDFKFTKYVDINNVAGSSYIEEEFRGKGFGKSAYWELGMWLYKNGSTLRSARDTNRTEAANRVWKSLERDGFAKKVEDRYEFMNNTSKVVDKNGEPLVVYHGSNEEFNIFDITKKRYNIHNKGIFFTDTFKKASKYGKNIIESFINIKNLGESSYTEDMTLDDLRKQENTLLDNDKYDGVKFITVDKEGFGTIQYAVKNPNQIKSATDNIGTYSITNNDIRFRAVPLSVLKQSLQQESSKQNDTFESLSEDTKMYLANQGISKKEFNSWSQAEKEYAKECAGI